MAGKCVTVRIVLVLASRYPVKCSNDLLYERLKNSAANMNDAAPTRSNGPINQSGATLPSRMHPMKTATHDRAIC